MEMIAVDEGVRMEWNVRGGVRMERFAARVAGAILASGPETHSHVLFLGTSLMCLVQNTSLIDHFSLSIKWAKLTTLPVPCGCCNSLLKNTSWYVQSMPCSLLLQAVA